MINSFWKEIPSFTQINKTYTCLFYLPRKSITSPAHCAKNTYSYNCKNTVDSGCGA